MIGDNRPEGLWAEMAAICAGGYWGVVVPGLHDG